MDTVTLVSACKIGAFKVKKALLLLVVMTLLSGCASTNVNSKYSSSDINFAEMMIPHHEQAIEMSEIALRNTTNSEIVKLAQEIKKAQSPEIALMKSWAGVHSSSHASHMMEGMLSDDELSDLGQAKDKEFDILFLAGMIKHHEGAIKMASEVADSKNIDVVNLSESIIKAQRKEIAKMKELLPKS